MYEMERNVNCSNIGADGVMKNSAIIDFLQDCSVLHLDTHPVMSPFFEKEKCVMFLVSRQLDIIRRPGYQEKVKIKTWTYELKRMYGYRNTVILPMVSAYCRYLSASASRCAFSLSNL